jgi:hypothetical protein
MALGRKNVAVATADGGADVFRLAGFLGDDDLVGHDGSTMRKDFGGAAPGTYSELFSWARARSLLIERGTPRESSMLSHFAAHRLGKWPAMDANIHRRPRSPQSAKCLMRSLGRGRKRRSTSCRLLTPHALVPSLCVKVRDADEYAIERRSGSSEDTGSLDQRRISGYGAEPSIRGWPQYFINQPFGPWRAVLGSGNAVQRSHGDIWVKRLFIIA